MTPFDHYYTVFQSATELLWIVAPTGTIVTANDAVHTLWRTTPAAIEGTLLWDDARWTSDAAHTLHAAWDAVVAGTPHGAFEVDNPFPNKSLLCLEVSIHPLTSEEDDTDYWLVEGVDISPRKQALTALQASQTRLWESQQLANIGSGVWNLLTGESFVGPVTAEILGVPDTVLTFERFVELIHPDDRDYVLQTIQSHLATDSPYKLIYRVVRPDGTERVIRGMGKGERAADGRPTRVHGVIQDITERTQLEAAAAQWVERLETFSMLAQTMAARLDAEQVYQDVTAALRPLIGAEGMFVLVQEEGVLEVKAGTVPTRETIKGMRVPIIGSPAGDVWRTGDSLLLRREEWIEAQYYTLYEDIDYQPNVIALAPLGWQDQRLGVLHASHHDPDAFSADDMRLLETAASWLAIALMNARLWESQRQARGIAEARRRRMNQMTRRIVLAQEQERQRLARELHDESGQSLTALKISLELLQQVIDDPDLKEGVVESATLAGDTMEHIRRLSHQLRPPALDTFGLDVTLDGLCNEITHYTGVKVTYHSETIPAALSEVATIVLYRYVQEVLNHVTTYEGVTRVEVTLKPEPDRFGLEVRHNGKTRASDAPPVSEVVAERLELLEGSFTIERSRRKGGSITAWVPLDVEGVGDA